MDDNQIVVMVVHLMRASWLVFLSMWCSPGFCYGKMVERFGEFPSRSWLCLFSFISFARRVTIPQE
jgi:hypothetical protein